MQAEAKFEQINNFFYIIFIQIADKRVAYRFKDLRGSQRVIGMTVDNNGTLYCAKYRQGHIDVIDPK